MTVDIYTDQLDLPKGVLYMQLQIFRNTDLKY